MAFHTDTIAALATPPGKGALGIIRLSGPEALAIAEALMPKAKLRTRPSHTVHFGALQHNGELLDEAVATIFLAPKSFTTEDVVEFTCHGSAYILQKVLQACIQLGARLAAPGEFTMRAFMNGRMDLTQAEAVADLIEAEGEMAHKAAMQQMRGGFSTELQQLREQLINFASLIELELDFSEEDVEFADRTAFQQLISTILQRIQTLIQSFELGNVMKRGVSVAIVGRPNAGKSTLLNALLNEDRAIVSDIPGTTRDTIEEVLHIKGILFRLIDTAGIRSHGTDRIEHLGIERSRQNAAQADIVIYLKSMEDMFANAEERREIEAMEQWVDTLRHKVIEVNNKYDEAWDAVLQKKGLVVDLAAGIHISAKHRQHLGAVTEALYEKATQGKQVGEDTVVTNVRHLGALKKMEESLLEINSAMQQGLSTDLLAVDIRRCLHYLGEITGQVETDRDILGTIFGKFCIGK